MTRSDIIRMAREAGWSGTYVIQWADEPTGEPDWHPVKESMSVPVTMEQIERFFHAAYAAGAAVEREACAKVCDDLLANPHTGGGWSDAIIEAAVAIRARGTHERP